MKKLKSTTKAVRCNPVAKHARHFNKATAYRDRTKYSRKGKAGRLSNMNQPDDSK